MILEVAPGNPLIGTTSVPGDKSISHRVALLAGLSSGDCRIENFLVAGVTKVMLCALSELGIEWKLVGKTLTIKGAGLQRTSEDTDIVQLDCGNSGTTMRLLAGFVAALGLPAVLDGSARLRERPMKRILTPLQRMGVEIQASPGGGAPLSISVRPPERKLRALQYTLPVASAQVKSCILLAALAAEGETILTEPGLSRDHTERLLRSLGATINSQVIVSSEDASVQVETHFTPPDPLELEPFNLLLPGDFSSAAFLIVAAVITPGSEVKINNVGLNPTRTGLLDVLRSMGADIAITNRNDSGGEPLGDLHVRYSKLRGTTVSGAIVVRMIDEFPIFAVAATHANGRTVVEDATELRHKESDRIHDLCVELQRLGADLVESADGFVINGGKMLVGGRVGTHRDHRLAMALLVAGMGASGPVEIEQAEIITESFPQFVHILRNMGAVINEK